MPRKHRLEFPGAIYHINHRGNHHEYVCRDDDDRKLFLKLLKTTIGGRETPLDQFPGPREY